MTQITVEATKELEKGWLFEVRVDSHSFQVGLGQKYWIELTDKSKSPEELVEESFRFLLEREPMTSILSRFELPVIENYFPEYKKIIRAWARN